MRTLKDVTKYFSYDTESEAHEAYKEAHYKFLGNCYVR